ncbi:MAG: hypothetical protein GC178_10000 [Flavobacteriales bacterium]|nr:hypothetical protein [Flavobacteriales bacterium]
MKKLLTLIVFCAGLSVAFAQKVQTEAKNFDVFFGPKEKRDVGTTVGSFIGGDSEAFYTHFAKGREVTYAKYGYDLKRKNKNEIEYPKEKVLRNSEFHMEIDDAIYEFYSISDKKAKTNKLYCRTLNKDKLAPNKDDTEIFTLKGEAFYKNFANAFTQVDRSPDGGLFLVTLKLPEEKDRYRRFKFMVFDREFKPLWEKTEKFYISKDKVFKVVNQDWVSAGGGNFFFRMANSGSYNAFSINNEGEVLTWGVQDKGRDYDASKRFETYVFKITKESTKNAKVGFKDKKILSSSIRWSQDGKVMISGFYNDNPKTKYNLIDGAYLSFWDVDAGEPTHISFDAFTEEFKTQYWSERKVKKFEKEKSKGKDRVGMDLFYLDHTVQKSDGGVLLVGERFYTYYQRVGKMQIKKYVHGNIIVINVDPEGNILWSKKIPKHQDSANPNSVGYSFAYTNDKLYFIYNDNFKNIAPGWDGSKVYTFATGDNPVVIATCDISNDGEITREKAWTTDEAGGMLENDSKVDQLFSDEVIVYIQGGKGTQRLIRVELK